MLNYQRVTHSSTIHVTPSFPLPKVYGVPPDMTRHVSEAAEKIAKEVPGARGEKSWYNYGLLMVTLMILNLDYSWLLMVIDDNSWL